MRLALLKQGLAIARERNDTRLEALIGTQLVWVLVPFGHDANRRARWPSASSRSATPNATRTGRPRATGRSRRSTRASATGRMRSPSSAVHAKSMRPKARRGVLRRCSSSSSRLPSDAGDASVAREAAAAFRTIADDAPEWRPWLPLLDAHLAKLGGDSTGAADALDRLLDTNPPIAAPIAQAALFQLGRWQLALGRADALLARAAWKPWLDQHPDAIALTHLGASCHRTDGARRRRAAAARCAACCA